MTENSRALFKPSRQPYFTTLIVAGILYVIAMAADEGETFSPFNIFAGIVFLVATYNRLKDLNYPRILTFLGIFPGLNILMTILLAQRLTRNDKNLFGGTSSADANFSLSSLLNHYIPPELADKAFKTPQTKSWAETKPEAPKPWVDPNDRYARAAVPKKTAVTEKKTYNVAPPVYKKTEAVKRSGISANAPTVQRSRRD